ncbi:MAG: efflux RND transporter periplasmic adaptor subunit [Candidatus Gastranaerophilales bacterium]|nr:efflux RND transporter periplasmic adaptor subunit [Candidatus Gastranaerophilales bacterium]
MDKKLKIIIILIAVILTAAGLFFALKAKNTVIYETEPIKRCTITETVEASGTINPVNTVDIGAGTSGLITDIYVDYNSKVKKNQVLAQIDPSIPQAQVDKAQNDLNSARANYQKTKSLLNFEKKNYDRYKKLYAKNYVSKSDLDLAEANYFAKLAELNSMQAIIQQNAASLQTGLTNLRYTKIISPVDGTVVSRSVDVGQMVVSSFQTPTLFLVAQDLTEMQIEVNVSEADIGKVHVGQEVEYTLDGYPDLILKGEVSQVRISPTTVSNVVTYNVIVLVDNESQQIKPGMSANVSIITAKSENVLCAPLAALRFSPTEITGGQKFEQQGLWLLKDKKPERVGIKTGAKNSSETEIISKDIKENDEVITSRKGDKGKNSMPKPPMRMF